MAARTNTEVVSKLPTYKAGRSKQYPGWALVYCPREDCPSHSKGDTTPFLVQMAAFWAKRVYRKLSGEESLIKARACPYCMRTSYLPTKPRR